MANLVYLTTELTPEFIGKLGDEYGDTRCLLVIQDYDAVYYAIREHITNAAKLVHDVNNDLPDISTHKGFTIGSRPGSIISGRLIDKVRYIDILIKWILFTLAHRSAASIIERIESIIATSIHESNYTILYHFVNMFVEHYNEAIEYGIDEIDTVLLAMLYCKGFGTYICLTHCQRVNSQDVSFLEFNEVFVHAILRMEGCVSRVNNSIGSTDNLDLYRVIVVDKSFGYDWGFITSQVYSSFSTCIDTALNFAGNKESMKDDQYSCILVLPCKCINIKKLPECVKNRSREEHLVSTENTMFVYKYKFYSEERNLYTRIIIPSQCICECRLCNNNSLAIKRTVGLLKAQGFSQSAKGPLDI